MISSNSVSGISLISETSPCQVLAASNSQDCKNSINITDRSSQTLPLARGPEYGSANSTPQSSTLASSPTSPDTTLNSDGTLLSNEYKHSNASAYVSSLSLLSGK